MSLLLRSSISICGKCANEVILEILVLGISNQFDLVTKITHALPATVRVRTLLGMPLSQDKRLLFLHVSVSVSILNFKKNQQQKLTDSKFQDLGGIP